MAIGSYSLNGISGGDILKMFLIVILFSLLFVIGTASTRPYFNGKALKKYEDKSL